MEIVAELLTVSVSGFATIKIVWDEFQVLESKERTDGLPKAMFSSPTTDTLTSTIESG